MKKYEASTLTAVGLIVLAACSSAAAPGPASSTTASSAAPTPALLRYKFVKGNHHAYKLEVDRRRRDASGVTDQHFDVTMHQSVEDVDPATGNATVQMQIDSLAMTLDRSPVPLPGGSLGPFAEP